MFDDDHDDTKTASAPLELAEDFTPREVLLLTEAVAMAATAALGGMACSATFIPEAAAFVVRPAVVVSPGALH